MPHAPTDLRYEPTDLRQMSATSIAVARLGFEATETGARFDAISNRGFPVKVAARIIRHADHRAEALIRDDAPTPA